MKNYKSKLILLMALCLALVFAACTNGSFDVVRNGGSGGGNGGGGSGEDIPVDYTFPLCFESEEDGTVLIDLELVYDHENVEEDDLNIVYPELEYSIDDCQTWNAFKSLASMGMGMDEPGDEPGDGTGVTLKNKGDKVYFRAKTKTNTFSNEKYWFKFIFEASTTIAVSGNVMSLLDPDFKLTEISTPYCFKSLFDNCWGLTMAPGLPATKLAERCYNSMFEGCSNLKDAPALPATKLARDCYNGMFRYCENLKEAPALPATTLAEWCYNCMFEGCTALEKAPALPATTLAERCYNGMFRDCSNLKDAPALGATTLAEGCYYYMFQLCTSLTKAPALPATTLANYCYSYMFSGCTSLTKAPVLPAEETTRGCYIYMFERCSNLAYIKVYFKDWKEDPNFPAKGATYCWFEGGVSSEGEFHYTNLTEIYQNSVSHVPSGWEYIKDPN